LLPPESSPVEVVSREIGVSSSTLERWRAEALAASSEQPTAKASLDEIGKSAWCRQQGMYPRELERWRMSAVVALAAPEEARASPEQTRQDHRRIKELERELKRKEAEAAD